MSRWVDIDDISLLKTVSVGGLSAKALWKRIRQQPSIDLVHCRECKKWFEYDGVNFCYRTRCTAKADGFCSYGERRADNE